MKQSKNNYSAAFKAKMACNALRESKTINELGSENGVHPDQIVKWKKTVLEESKILFERKNKSKQESGDFAELQRIVGEQTIQLAWYKKKLGSIS